MRKGSFRLSFSLPRDVHVVIIIGHVTGRDGGENSLRMSGKNCFLFSDPFGRKEGLSSPYEAEFIQNPEPSLLLFAEKSQISECDSGAESFHAIDPGRISGMKVYNCVGKCENAH